MLIENIGIAELAEASSISHNTLFKIIHKRKSIRPEIQNKIIIGLNKITEKNHFGFEIFKKGEKKLINDLKKKELKLQSIKKNLKSIKDEKVDLEKTLHFKTIRLEDFEKKFKKYNLYKIDSYIIQIPKSIKTAFQQYLLFFKDYVENIKNQEIYFEVIRITEGLRIDIDYSGIELTEISEWFNEYLALLQSKDSVRPENYLTEKVNSTDIFIEELKGQISKLEMSLELVKSKNQLLLEEQRFLKDLTLQLTSKENRIKEAFNDKRNELKLKLAKGNIEPVLNFMLENLKDDTENYDLAINCNFRYYQIKKENIKGTIKKDIFNLEVNKIIDSIIEIINKI